MRTKTVTVQSTKIASNVAAALVVRSMWFEVTPMPDDQFEFTVKAEALGFLNDEVEGQS